MGKRARPSTNKRRSSRVENRQTVAGILKRVRGATAVLSLVFGVIQFLQIVAAIRAQQHQIAELLRVGELQQATRDYSEVGC
jgi:hypothetical protein